MLLGYYYMWQFLVHGISQYQYSRGILHVSVFHQDRLSYYLNLDRVVVFGKMAETAAEYMKKGQLVYIEGRLQTRSWEDKDKVKRYTTEILCDNFTMLGPKRDNIPSSSIAPIRAINLSSAIPSCCATWA